MAVADARANAGEGWRGGVGNRPQKGRCSRIGRGHAAADRLKRSAEQRGPSERMGRVLIKARIDRLKRGSKGADAHLRYYNWMEDPGRERGGCMGQRPTRSTGGSLWSAGGRTAISSVSMWRRGRRPAFNLRAFTAMSCADGGRPPNQTRLGRGRSFQHWPSTQPCSDPSQGRHGQGSHHRPGLYVIDGLRLRARSRRPWNWDPRPIWNCAGNSRPRLQPSALPHRQRHAEGGARSCARFAARVWQVRANFDCTLHIGHLHTLERCGLASESEPASGRCRKSWSRHCAN